MSDTKCKSVGLLLTRLVLAAIFLYHGLPKTDIAFAMDKFVAMGFPGFLGPIVGWLEVIGGILLLVGIYHKWANYVLAAIIFVAVVAVQVPKALAEGKFIAGLERDLLMLAGHTVLIAFGPGMYAVQDKYKQWRGE